MAQAHVGNSTSLLNELGNRLENISNVGNSRDARHKGGLFRAGDSLALNSIRQASVTALNGVVLHRSVTVFYCCFLTPTDAWSSNFRSAPYQILSIACWNDPC